MCVCVCVCVQGGVCCAQINAGFVDIERKVEMDVKKELTRNHESVTKNMDKVSRWRFFGL